MGIILARAAGLQGGYYVAQTQSYGPESRGGACRSEVVISDEPIDYMKALAPDLFVAMSQPAVERYIGDVRPETGIVLVDDTLVSRIPTTTAHLYRLPATELAEERFGKRIVANMIMLGGIAAVWDLVPLSALEPTVRGTVAKDMAELNLSALHLGYRILKG